MSGQGRYAALVHFLFRDHPWAGGYKYSSSTSALGVLFLICSSSHNKWYTCVRVCVSVRRKVFNLSWFSGCR